MRLILIRPNYVEKSFESTTILIKEIPKDCIYEVNYTQIYVPDCETLHLGARIFLTLTSSLGKQRSEEIETWQFSTLAKLTDTLFETKKSLVAREVTIYQYSVTSPNDWLLKIEELIFKKVMYLEAVLYQNMPSTSAWLVVNSVLGYVAEIPREHDSSLDILGLQHLIAVSGYHVSFLIILLATVWPTRLGRSTRLIGITICIVCFWMAVGFQPSVNRAVCMSLLMFFAREYCFLQVRPLRILMLVGCVWLLVEPLTLGSVSFQLSYLATLGILVFFGENNLIANLETGQMGSSIVLSVKKLLVDSLKVSAVAQLYTAGVIWYYFQQYPLMSLVVNAVIFWLPPLLILLGLYAILAASFSILPFMVTKTISYISINFFIAVPAELIAGGLSLGGRFERTLIALPPLSFYHYLILLTTLAVITWYQVKSTTQSQERTLQLQRILQHV